MCSCINASQILFSEQQELRDSLNSHDYWLKPMKSTVSFLRAFVRAMNREWGSRVKSNVSSCQPGKSTKSNFAERTGTVNHSDIH